MNRKFHWYNFADARRPSSEDIRLERQAQQLEVTGPSSPVPMGGKKREKSGKDGPTGAEIKAAKKDLKGGKAKNCTVGKSCNATCIYYKDDCISIFPDENIQSSLSAVRDRLRTKVERGEISEEEASRVFGRYTGLEKLKDQERELKGETGLDAELKGEIQKQELRKRSQELTKAYAEMEKAYPDPREREKAFNRTVDGVLETAFGVKNPGAAVSEGEVEGIFKLQDRVRAAAAVYDAVRSGKITTAEQMRDALRGVAEGYRVNKVTDAEVQLAMAFMPLEARTFLGKAGSVAEGGHFPPGSKSDVIPTSFGPVQKANSEQQRGRAELLVRIGLESGWRDVYSGQKIPLLETDLEHIIPASYGGKMSEQGFNYGLTKSRLNRGKSEGSPDYFDIRNPDGYFYVSPTGKASSKKREEITFDSNGRLTPRGRELHALRESAGNVKGKLEDKLLNKGIKAADAIDMIEASGLPADKKAKLIGKVISFWTEGSARTVAVGMQSAKEGTQARAAQPWYWYGGPSSAGGNPAGKAIASKVAELQAKGDTEGLKKLGALLAKAQQEMLRLNDQDWNGTRIRDLEMSAETGSRKAVANMIAEIREGILPQILAL